MVGRFDHRTQGGGRVETEVDSSLSWRIGYATEACPIKEEKGRENERLPQLDR